MTVDTKPDEFNTLAAEYALRLLEGNELEAANLRYQNEPDFAQAVRMWEVRFSGLADTIEETPPSPATKQALFQRLFPEARPAALWDKIAFWKWISLASILLTAGLAFFALNPPQVSDGPLYTAEIVSDAGDFRVVAVVDKSTDEVFLTRTRGAAPEGRILQVWAHGPDEPAFPVGLWPEGDSIRLVLPDLIAAVDGTLTLGVSEEPPGGSTTGSPSGRVFGTVDIPDVVAYP